MAASLAKNATAALVSMAKLEGDIRLRVDALADFFNRFGHLPRVFVRNRLTQVSDDVSDGAEIRVGRLTGDGDVLAWAQLRRVFGDNNSPVKMSPQCGHASPRDGQV